MTNTKAGRTLDTIDFFPHHFDIPKASTTYLASIEASKLIHSLEKSTPESPFKVDESELAAMKKLSENFKCVVQPPYTQRPQQGIQFLRVEQLTPQVTRMVGETTQVPRVENQTPPTLGVEPIAPQINVPEKKVPHQPQ